MDLLRVLWLRSVTATHVRAKWDRVTASKIIGINVSVVKDDILPFYDFFFFFAILTLPRVYQLIGGFSCRREVIVL